MDVHTQDNSSSEIFVYDGVSTIQLTDNRYLESDVDVSGSTIVWTSWNEAGSEVFMATIPEPSMQTMLMAAGLVLLPFVRRQR